MKKRYIVAVVTALFYSSICYAQTTSKLLASSVAAVGVPNASTQKFQTLFNGKDLSGWKGKAGLWRVENGTIVGETKAEAPIPANTFLIWQGGQVVDFEFSCQVKFTGNNSGVQYRSEVFGDPDDLALRGLWHNRQNKTRALAFLKIK